MTKAAKNNLVTKLQAAHRLARFQVAMYALGYVVETQLNAPAIHGGKIYWTVNVKRWDINANAFTYYDTNYIDMPIASGAFEAKIEEIGNRAITSTNNDNESK